MNSKALLIAVLLGFAPRSVVRRLDVPPAPKLINREPHQGVRERARRIRKQNPTIQLARIDKG